MRLDHVLVAVDFSPAWENLKQRLGYLKPWGVRKLTLVHVLSTRYPAAPAETHRDAYTGDLKAAADALQQQGFTVETELRTGEPGYELVQAAREHSADMILAGARGHSRFHDFFLGSTALDLARLADRPVWLEPLDAEVVSDTTRILLATDGSEAAGGAERYFAALAPKAERALALQAVVCSDPQDAECEEADAKRHLADLVSRTAGIETRTDCGPAPQVIAERAAEGEFSLILVGKRGRTALQELFLGSTAEAVLRAGRRPVLLVPGDALPPETA
ncbi:MAG: universal stress protein [Rhodovibrio sp.]|nr:universal stress protein [Rhodovibrio sp.]